MELLDGYFGTVRELDIVYHFATIYAILDEFICAGEVQETSKPRLLMRLKNMPQIA